VVEHSDEFPGAARTRPVRIGNPFGVAREAEELDQAADELYGLPRADFTKSRDELAKRLRDEGRRDLAGEVKALRKPTLAAWALNQLVRHRRKDVERLLAAGRELREAQEELVASGDRSGFQSAAAEERRLVAELARDAASLAGEAGVGSTQGLEEKLVATLHAAALDEDTADELEAGRVVRERQAVAGFGGVLGGQVETPPKRTAKPKAPRKDDAAERKRQKDEDAQRREELSAARVAERRARRELEAAEKSRERAAGRVGKAEERAAEASRQLEEARRELDEAEAQERDARDAHAEAADTAAAAEKKLG
jgi:hypothetical protein